ncbi:MgtC/SapB family protein [Aureimonas mangrovi]|uniref:MgtC/SapB family protein n=1 Tax=Aureimonas mangrovi TaxID=2758041 RepID=UPI00163DB3A6|nr:MgtC/SapB family protein [Aureimonas mangrovi]
MSEWEIVGRLALSALLASVVGIERERLLWAAGLRTHMLVGVGATLVMIVSAYGFDDMPGSADGLDPSRMAAQVVSGIGFLGAGTILLRGNAIKGLTTAASLWSVGAIGLAVGGGLYFAAVATTVLLLIILAGIKPIEKRFRDEVLKCQLVVEAESGTLNLDRLHKTAAPHALQRTRIGPMEDGGETATLYLHSRSAVEADEAVQRFRALPGVRNVYVTSGS